MELVAPGLGIVDDQFLIIARPNHIDSTVRKRHVDGMKALHEEAILAAHRQSSFANASQDLQQHDDIGAVDQFNAKYRLAGLNGRQTEPHDKHRAPPDQTVQTLAHHVR